MSAERADERIAELVRLIVMESEAHPSPGVGQHIYTTELPATWPRLSVWRQIVTAARELAGAGALPKDGSNYRT